MVALSYFFLLVKNHDKSFAVSSNSVYPPTFDQFVDVCERAGFSNNCKYMLQESAGCWGLEIETKEDLSKCLSDSKYVQDLVGRYQRGESKDMCLHETMGFKNFNSESSLCFSLILFFSFTVCHADNV